MKDDGKRSAIGAITEPDLSIGLPGHQAVTVNHTERVFAKAMRLGRTTPAAMKRKHAIAIASRKNAIGGLTAQALNVDGMKAEQGMQSGQRKRGGWKNRRACSIAGTRRVTGAITELD